VRILTANIDGVVAAHKSGFFSLPHVVEADILCLQETKADDVEALGRSLGYYCVSADRQRSGRKALHGGVAIMSRFPLGAREEVHEAHAQRGQFIACSVGQIRVASVYVTLDAHPAQFQPFTEQFNKMMEYGGGGIICGDFNTFRNSNDSWRFQEALSRSELGTDATARQWLEGVIGAGWIDVVRKHHQARPFYTWWWSEAHFSQKRGTRLDYILTSPNLASAVDPASVAVVTSARRGRHAQLALSLAIEG
jgi:exodeoxyribonuclease III